MVATAASMAGGVDKKNAKALDYADHAADLPRFFVPVILKHRHVGLVGNQLPFLATLTELSHGLAIRAMLELHRGNLAGCERDLLAIHHIARLLCQSQIIISLLVAFSIDRTACNGDWAMANSGWITGRQYRAYAQALRRLRPIAGIAADLNHGERFCALDILQRLNSAKFKQNAGAMGLKSLIARHPWTQQDLRIAARVINQIADRQTAAAASRDFIEEEQVYQRIRRWKIRRLSPSGHRVDGIVASFIRQFDTRASRVMLMEAASRAVTRMDDIAMALAAYRADHGIYPGQLSKLVPHYLASLPIDPFTGKALIYSANANGCKTRSQGRFSRKIMRHPFVFPIQFGLTFPPGRYSWRKAAASPGR